MGVIFLKYYLIYLLLLVVFYNMGSILFKILSIKIKDKFTGLFGKFLLSITLFTCTTAILFTNGITIMWGVIILMGIGYFFYKKDKLPDFETTTDLKESNFNFSNYLFILIGSSLFFIYRFYQIYNPNGSVPLTPHGDIIYYSNLVDFFLRFGYENSSIDSIYPKGVSPYHYYDIWMDAGIVKIFGLNSALSLVLLIYSISLFLIWMGITALLSYYKKLNKLDILICWCCVFTIGIYFEFFTKIDFFLNIGVFACNAVNYNKLFPIYIFIFPFILFYINKKYTLAYLCLLCIPIVFISTAIGLLSACFLFLIYSKIVLKRNILRETFLLFITAAIIYLFYKLFPAIETHVSTDFSTLIKNLTDISYIKTMINIAGGTTIQIGLIFLPYLILFLLNFKLIQINKQHRDLILLSILIYFISLGAWAILHRLTSTVQVFSNIAVVLLNIIAMFALFATITKDTKLKPYNAVLLILILFLSIKISINNLSNHILYVQSPTYLENVINESSKLNKNGAFIFTEEDYKQIGFSYIANFAKPGSYLIYSTNRTFPLSISPFSYPISENKEAAEREMSSLKTTPFWKFVESKKRDNTFISIAQAQLEFIQKFNINYVICSKSATLAPEISKLVKKEIKDQNTGERFYLLN